MKILSVVAGVQHPALPGSRRHYYLLRSLARRHVVTVLALTRAEVSPEVEGDLAELAKGGWRAFRSIPNALLSMPDVVSRRLAWWRALSAMRAECLRLVRSEPYDVVVFHGKTAYPAIAGLSGLPLVVDFCDASHSRELERLRVVAGTARLMQLVRCHRMAQLERRLLRAARHHSFISERDRVGAGVAAGDDTPVIPNGIDLDYWRQGNVPREPATLVFTGVMNYPPNEDAALYLIREILPRIRPHLPDLRLVLVGPQPTPALLEAGRTSPEVTITGLVEDVRPYMDRATLFVAPLRFASGMQNKILEALAMELPVVTSATVLAGLERGTATPPVAVADSPDDHAAAIQTLLADDLARARAASEGRRFVETHFDWAKSGDAFEALCLRAVRDAALARGKRQATPGGRTMSAGGAS